MEGGGLAAPPVPFYKSKGKYTMQGSIKRTPHGTARGLVFPPNYVDPPVLLRMRDRYLLNWQRQGKRIDQWRRALALALARRQYYSHTIAGMSMYDWGCKMWYKQRAWYSRNVSGHLIENYNAEGRAVSARRRRIRKEQKAQLAAGKPVRRQFYLPVG